MPLLTCLDGLEGLAPYIGATTRVPDPSPEKEYPGYSRTPSCSLFDGGSSLLRNRGRRGGGYRLLSMCGCRYKKEDRDSYDDFLILGGGEPIACSA